MTEYLRLSLRLDKLKRQMMAFAALHADEPQQVSALFDREVDGIRSSAASELQEWIGDQLQDLAYACGMATVDAAMLRMVRAGLLTEEELFENCDCCCKSSANDEHHDETELLIA